MKPAGNRLILVRPHLSRENIDSWAVDRYTLGGRWMGSTIYTTKKDAQEHARRARRRERAASSKKAGTP